MKRYFSRVYMCLLLTIIAGCAGNQPLATLQPTATPLSPAALLQRADGQRDVGQVDQALADYQSVIQQYPNAPEARVARFGIGYSSFLRQDWAAARSQLAAFVDENSNDEWHPRALFLLGRVAEVMGDHGGAIEAYRRYEALNAPLSGYAAQRRAAQLNVIGQHDQAIQAYEWSGRQPMAGAQRVASLNAAIQDHDANGRADAALNNVTAILDFARSPGFRATTLLDASRRAREINRPDLAQAWLLEIVQRHPETAEASQALLDLAQLGIQVSPLEAATIHYNHQRYGDAISYFDQVLAGELTPEQRTDIRRKRALAIREQGTFDEAYAELQAIADEQPDTRIGRQARLDAIQTNGQRGDREGAKQAYIAFADKYPDDPLAHEALRRVVEITSWSGDPVATANAQLTLGQRYPWSSEGQQALHDAALYAWNNQYLDQALAAWQLLGDTNIGMPRAEGYYWAGRLEANRGNQEAGAKLLQQAYAAAPNSYYGARAYDMLGLNETAGLSIGADITPEAEQQGWQWIESWATKVQSDTLDVDGYRIRAQELRWVDLHAEALDEWIGARDAAGNNAFLLYPIALASFRDHTPYATVAAARKLVELAPVEAGEPPIAVRQLLYPTPYATAVIGKSQEFSLNPLVLYAVMRQESVFNPDATSWVGARGLAQVMPATGEGIAQQLGIQGYSPNDLYNPVTSIRFGAYYISQQIQYMNGSLHGAFAAYNGGPGNAERWANGRTVGDPDFFIQTIDYGETRHYVEVVYANYGAYRRLYRAP